MHPVESVLLDGVSVALAFPAARFTVRQGMWFTTVVTFKAICDHAGYDIPWNPVYSFPYANDVWFHNLHHQSWGLKVGPPSPPRFSDPHPNHHHPSKKPSLTRSFLSPQHNFGIYSLFWDWLLGTLWTDQAAANQKYARYHQIAEEQFAASQTEAAVRDGGSSSSSGPRKEKSVQISQED